MWWSNQIDEKQQQALQEQVKWKCPERPVLKSWTIEARDYDTKQMGWFYVIGNLFIIVTLMFLNWAFTDKQAPVSLHAVRLIFILLMFIMFYWLIHSLAFARKLLVYRFTNEGFEVAGWSRQAEGQRKIFIGAAIVCSIIALFIVALVPQAFILLFIGPGGIVLMMVAMSGNSQAFELQRDYRQKEFEWNEFTKLRLFDKRAIITFEFDEFERQKKTQYIFLDIFHIFCPLERYEEIIAFIKDKTASIPCVKENTEIYKSACS